MATAIAISREKFFVVGSVIPREDMPEDMVAGNGTVRANNR